MRRMFLLVTMAAMLAVMVIASAVPAMAAVPEWCNYESLVYDPSCDQESGKEIPEWCIGVQFFMYEPACDPYA